jgi:two-component system sporulation sensor kinase A
MQSEYHDDIFEKKLDERLIYEMGEISSELAHDLRSPLQTIQNSVFLLERSPNNPAFYALIKESLAHATRILDNFRDFYKGHLLNKVESDLEKIFMLAMSEANVPENITLKTHFEVPHKILVDPTKVSLVFVKLIRNSIEAMSEGGKIEVNVFEGEDEVVVEVSDNGPGISEEVEDVIYKPFHSESKRGTGLGIPTCLRIIESHGGSLSYDTSRGEGTVFTFTLPKGR